MSEHRAVRYGYSTASYSASILVADSASAAADACTIIAFGIDLCVGYVDCRGRAARTATDAGATHLAFRMYCGAIYGDMRASAATTTADAGSAKIAERVNVCLCARDLYAGKTGFGVSATANAGSQNATHRAH